LTSPSDTSEPTTTHSGIPQVRIADVTKHFGDRVVLDRISMEVRQGEVVVIAGVSGSGKSTLLRCVNGLETISSGEVWFQGEQVTNEPHRLQRLRTDIGMVFQGFHLFPHLRVIDNLTLAPMRVRHMTKSQARSAAEELLARVGLADYAGRYPGRLSGGQQQRVAIARALAMRPKMMLFDEPTSALDPEMIREVLDVMRELARDGMTMLVVTHEMGFAREVGDRLVFVDEGRIVEQGEPRALFEAPQSPRLREFLDKLLHH
jgi:ABC-type polar amino acid transport system ATPase subunit